MDNYPYPSSYADSGDSSPRSREIEFENTLPWDENHNSYRVKFMCSYGGKIQPRPHDNQLSYTGGETKILSVDRGIKFGPLIAKLSSLCDSDGSVTFKYQLPGEDLDALISVTNEDDLEHMMHEYDRLFRASPKPARLRIFLFPAPPTPTPSAEGPRSFGSDMTSKSEKDRFVEALNSGPIQTTAPPSSVAPPPQPQSGNADFLFGLEKVAPQPTMHNPPPQQVAPVKLRDRESELIGSESIQKHIQDLQRLRIEEQQGFYAKKSDENLSAGYTGGEYYMHQKLPEKAAPTNTPPATMAPPAANYWPEKQVTAGGVFPASSYAADPHQLQQPPQPQLQNQQQQQQVYMIPGPPPNAYHGQMMRQMAGPTGQGYYAVHQRMPDQFYREQQQQMHQPPPQYNVAPQMGAPVHSLAPPPPTIPHQQPKMTPAYGGVAVTETGYPQVAYDGAGRAMYYTPQGGMGVMGGPPQYQAMAAATSGAAAGGGGGVSGDRKALNQEGGGKVAVPKVTHPPL